MTLGRETTCMTYSTDHKHQMQLSQHQHN